MTVKELINTLQDVDNDIMDYEVCFTGSIQLAEGARLAVRIPVHEVQENVDVDGKKLFLKSKTK